MSYADDTSEGLMTHTEIDLHLKTHLKDYEVSTRKPHMKVERRVLPQDDPRRNLKNWVEDGPDPNNPSQPGYKYVGPRLLDPGPWQQGDPRYDAKVNPNVPPTEEELKYSLMNQKVFMKPLLSILIPTVPKRKKTFDALYRMLEAQRLSLMNPESVEIVTLSDNGEMMVGAKRNKLLDMAQGEYLCFIDDDDRVFGDYLERILAALETRPDVVGITIFWSDDDFKSVRLLVRSLEFHWKNWFSRPTTSTNNITCGRPAHLNPTRSSIAKSVRFPEDVQRGEDAAWSAQVAPKCKTCVTIDPPIYHYRFMTEGTITQRPGARESLRPVLPEGHQWAMRDGLIVELNKCGEVVKTVTSVKARPTET